MASTFTEASTYKVVASQDLRGLGATEAPPLVVNWTPPSRVPIVLPWLALLVLLVLRMNHGVHAWLALLPYVAVVAAQAMAGMLPQVMDSNTMGIILSMLKVLTFALTSAWLLLPVLKASYRFVAFLKLLAALWCGAGFAFFCEQTAGGLDIGAALAVCVSAGLLSLALAIAICMGGWHCRKQFGWAKLLAWTFLWSAGVAVLTMGSVLGLASIAGNGPGLRDFLLALGVAGGLIYGPLLVYLLLSMLNHFHGARLKAWLNAPETAVPPTINVEHLSAPVA